MQLKLQDALSLMNAIAGFCAIILAHLELFELAVIMLILAVLLDGADGMIARRSKPSALGLNLDSLADMISFGLAPAAMAFFLLNTSHILVLGAIYILCGMIRLARYNISPQEWPYFEGLPITAAGLMLGVGLLLNSLLFTSMLFIVLSALMISTIPYPKLRDTRIVPVSLIIGLAALYAFSMAGIRASAVIILLSFIPYLILPVVRACIQQER